MNTIVVREVSYEATATAIEKLKATGAIYWCDDHKAWHLTPDHDFDVEEVEIILNMGEE